MNSLGMSGFLKAKLIKAPKAPLSWRVQNALRWSYMWGLICNSLAKAFSGLTGIPTITAELKARLLLADGSIVDYGVLSRRVVTDTGVGFLVDDWDTGATEIANMNYHACGTGTGNEAASDSALGSEATTITDRATGTKSQPLAYQLQSVGTQSFTNTGAITEHGLFSVVTESTGVLWDRSKFTAINVGNGDSIQWTYVVSINSGS